MDLLALILTVAALIMFLFAASGRELRRFNEIALGLVFLEANACGKPVIASPVVVDGLGLRPLLS